MANCSVIKGESVKIVSSGFWHVFSISNQQLVIKIVRIFSQWLEHLTLMFESLFASVEHEYHMIELTFTFLLSRDR